MALALTACSASPPAMVKADGVERVSAERSAYPAEFAQLRASARTLGAALLADGGNAGSGNVVSSPGSLLIALAMLRAGASGATAAEMDSVLGLPAEHRDEALNALLASLEAFDGDPGSVDEKDPPRRPVLHTANGLFVDKGEPTGEGYLQSLARYYGTGVYPVDFQDEAATKPAIDAWVNQNTGGRIKKAPAKYDRRNTFSVLNAVYFASAWKVPFDPADTSDLPFTTPDGGQVSVPTMSGVQDLAFARGAGWQAVDLPYAEGFVMRLVLPDSGASMPGAQEPPTLPWPLKPPPRRPCRSSCQSGSRRATLNCARSSLIWGCRRCSKPRPTSTQSSAASRSRKPAQSATITVAEKGTVAAAVTQINARAVSGVAATTVIHFDRPFHYEIIHVETGLPLFMGRVSDPRPSGGS